MQADHYVPLVEVTRGDIVESIHYGAFCVADCEGRLLAQAGDPELITYPRSSLKPFQALPLIEGGGINFFGLTGEEIAVMCGSHSGTAFHQSVIAGMHQKIGVTESDLACGVHWPYDVETREAMKLANQSPTTLHHNCSGKHTGMLAYAQMRGFSIDMYLDLQHPVQAAIRETLAEMVAMAADDMPVGMDGCSSPVYGVPLARMAQAVAKMADPVGLEGARKSACRTITTAMIAHPIMVAGPGQFDTDLMIAASSKVFSKGGAEGYQIIGILPGAIHASSPGVGIVIKISDGDPHGRARSSVTLTILRALGVLDEDALTRLDAYGNVPVRNWRKIQVGEVRPAFYLPDFMEMGV